MKRYFEFLMLKWNSLIPIFSSGNNEETYVFNILTINVNQGRKKIMVNITVFVKEC